MEAQQAIHCFDVAWWMYHSICLLEGYHTSIPQQPRLGEPFVRRFLQQGYPRGTAWMESCHQPDCQLGYPNTSFLHCSQLVRRLPNRGPACKPSTSSTRLLRRTHIPDQAKIRQREVQGRRKHPRELDRKGWKRVRQYIQGLECAR